MKRKKRGFSKKVESLIKAVKDVRARLRQITKEMHDEVLTEVLDKIDEIEIRFSDLLRSLDELERELKEVGA